jgi:hypothetical protein
MLRLRLGDVLLAAFALLLVLAVAHRAEHVQRSHQPQVGHAHALVRKA